VTDGREGGRRRQGTAPLPLSLSLSFALSLNLSLSAAGAGEGESRPLACDSACGRRRQESPRHNRPPLPAPPSLHHDVRVPSRFDPSGKRRRQRRIWAPTPYTLLPPRRRSPSSQKHAHRSWRLALARSPCARRPSSRCGAREKGSAGGRPRAPGRASGPSCRGPTASAPHRAPSSGRKSGGGGAAAPRRRARRPPSLLPLSHQATRTKVPLELEKGEMPMNTFSNKAPFKVRGEGGEEGGGWRDWGAIGARPTPHAAHLTAGESVVEAEGGPARARACRAAPTLRAPTPSTLSSLPGPRQVGRAHRRPQGDGRDDAHRHRDGRQNSVLGGAVVRRHSSGCAHGVLMASLWGGLVRGSRPLPGSPSTA